MPHLQSGPSGRRGMSKSSSKKNFTKHAVKANKKNFVTGVMRGGIRF